MSACAFILMLVVLILAIISLIGFWKSDSVLGAKWSITCMLIIVVACFYTSFRSEPFKIDDEVAFIGVIAAIVAVPVTVLLGWNIYTIIDIHKIRKEFDDFRNQTIQRMEGINNDLSNKVETSLIESHRSMALMNNKLEDDYFLLFHYMNMLIHQGGIGLYDDCRQTSEQIITIGQIQVIQHRRDSIFQLLGKIQNTNRISNYTSLVEYLSSNLIAVPMIRPSRTDVNNTN